MSLNSILAALPWLALLACPLMMGWMMRGKGSGMGGGCGHADGRADGQEDPRDAEIRSLKARLPQLDPRDRRGAA